MPQFPSLSPTSSRTSLTSLSTLSTTHSLASLPSRRSPYNHIPISNLLRHLTHFVLALVIFHILISLTLISPVTTSPKISALSVSTDSYSHTRSKNATTIATQLAALARTHRIEAVLDLSCLKHAPIVDRLLSQIPVHVEYICLERDSRRLQQRYEQLRYVRENDEDSGVRRIRFWRNVKERVDHVLVVAFEAEDGLQPETWIGRGGIVVKNGSGSTRGDQRLDIEFIGES